MNKRHIVPFSEEVAKPSTGAACSLEYPPIVYSRPNLLKKIASRKLSIEEELEEILDNNLKVSEMFNRVIVGKEEAVEDLTEACETFAKQFFAWAEEIHTVLTKDGFFFALKKELPQDCTLDNLLKIYKFEKGIL